MPRYVISLIRRFNRFTTIELARSYGQSQPKYEDAPRTFIKIVYS